MNKNTKTALIIIGSAIGILIIVSSILGAINGWRGWGMMGPGMMGNYGLYGGYGWWWIMPLVMFVFWGLVIAGLVLLIRAIARGSTSSSQKQADSALEILKQRYARGEISKQEFEEKKKDLE